MSILFSPPSDSPLTQGDILHGVSLYFSKGVTATDWKSEPGKCRTCLVLSRPCSVAHKQQVVVLAVEELKLEVKKLGTLDEVREFLATARDGGETPDCLYLGQIPQLGQGRFCARFDSIHTVILPSTRDQLTALLALRIARLSDDFVRDLHVRVFTSVARLGFDDFNWYSDADLNWIVQIGQKEIAEAQAALAEMEAGQTKQEQIEALRRKIATCTEKLAPYLAVQKQRKEAIVLQPQIHISPKLTVVPDTQPANVEST